MQAVKLRPGIVVVDGIAGSAIATVLARYGVQMMVLERQRTYRDRVRGEALVSRGLVEFQRLGLRRHYCTSDNPTPSTSSPLALPRSRPRGGALAAPCLTSPTCGRVTEWTWA